MSSRPYLLRTLRLGFRRFVAADSQVLGSVFADAYAAKFYPAMQEQQGLEAWIAWNLQNYEEHGFGLWALEVLESGRFIGDAGITYQTVEDQRLLEIGWHIHPDFRSQGYATEAARACIEFGFCTLKAPSLSSIVDPLNPASMKVAARVHSHRREYQGRKGPMLLYFTPAPAAA